LKSAAAARVEGGGWRIPSPNKKLHVILVGSVADGSKHLVLSKSLELELPDRGIDVVDPPGAHNHLAALIQQPLHNGEADPRHTTPHTQKGQP